MQKEQALQALRDGYELVSDGGPSYSVMAVYLYPREYGAALVRYHGEGAHSKEIPYTWERLEEEFDFTHFGRIYGALSTKEAGEEE